MNTLTKISTVIILSASVLSTAIAADEETKTSLSSLVAHTVKSTLADANNSINIDLQKSVLSSSHNLLNSSEDTPKGEVKIIDLASNENDKPAAKSEKAE